MRFNLCSKNTSSGHFRVLSILSVQCLYLWVIIPANKPVGLITHGGSTMHYDSCADQECGFKVGLPHAALFLASICCGGEWVHPFLSTGLKKKSLFCRLHQCLWKDNRHFQHFCMPKFIWQTAGFSERLYLWNKHCCKMHSRRTKLTLMLI